MNGLFAQRLVRSLKTALILCTLQYCLYFMREPLNMLIAMKFKGRAGFILSYAVTTLASRCDPAVIELVIKQPFSDFSKSFSALFTSTPAGTVSVARTLN